MIALSDLGDGSCTFLPPNDEYGGDGCTASPKEEMKCSPVYPPLYSAQCSSINRPTPPVISSSSSCRSSSHHGDGEIIITKEDSDCGESDGSTSTSTSGFEISVTRVEKVVTAVPNVSNEEDQDQQRQVNHNNNNNIHIQPLLIQIPKSSPIPLGIDIDMVLPIVSFIQPYSPLRHYVAVGDILLFVNGRSVMDLTHVELYSLLNNVDNKNSKTKTKNNNCALVVVDDDDDDDNVIDDDYDNNNQRELTKLVFLPAVYRQKKKQQQQQQQQPEQQSMKEEEEEEQCLDRQHDEMNLAFESKVCQNDKTNEDTHYRSDNDDVAVVQTDVISTTSSSLVETFAKHDDEEDEDLGRSDGMKATPSFSNEQSEHHCQNGMGDEVNDVTPITFDCCTPSPSEQIIRINDDNTINSFKNSILNISPVTAPTKFSLATTHNSSSSSSAFSISIGNIIRDGSRDNDISSIGEILGASTSKKEAENHEHNDSAELTSRGDMPFLDYLEMKVKELTKHNRSSSEECDGSVQEELGKNTTVNSEEKQTDARNVDSSAEEKYVEFIDSLKRGNVTDKFKQLELVENDNIEEKDVATEIREAKSDEDDLLDDRDRRRLDRKNRVQPQIEFIAIGNEDLEDVSTIFGGVWNKQAHYAAHRVEDNVLTQMEEGMCPSSYAQGRRTRSCHAQPSSSSLSQVQKQQPIIERALLASCILSTLGLVVFLVVTLCGN
jgi:hypothetical protein